jgi:hypothetical protein
MRLAPIILFVYNRPEHTSKTIDYLLRNELSKDSELYIFSDGPKDSKSEKSVEEVRKIIHQVKGFKKIETLESIHNRGLANSIIDGVSSVFKVYDSVIVLEDDLITSPNFLRFMNDALCFYKDVFNIWSVSGYSPLIEPPKNYPHDIYLSLRASSWGWGSWHDRWKLVDWELRDQDDFKQNKALQGEFDKGGNDLTPMLISQINGEIDSWAVRWNYAQFKYSRYSVVPLVSKIYNAGRDGTGIHSVAIREKFVIIDAGQERCLLEIVEPDEMILKQFKENYDLSKFKHFRMNILRKVGLYKIYLRLARMIMGIMYNTSRFFMRSS